jgi:predicted nucleic acid-binding protein
MIERLDLLWQLFDEVIIPQEVYNEIVVSEERLGAKELKKAIEDGNIRIHNV